MREREELLRRWSRDEISQEELVRQMVALPWRQTHGSEDEDGNRRPPVQELRDVLPEAIYFEIAQKVALRVHDQGPLALFLRYSKGEITHDDLARRLGRRDYAPPEAVDRQYGSLMDYMARAANELPVDLDPDIIFDDGDYETLKMTRWMDARRTIEESGAAGAAVRQWESGQLTDAELVLQLTGLPWASTESKVDEAGSPLPELQDFRPVLGDTIYLQLTFRIMSQRMRGSASP